MTQQLPDAVWKAVRSLVDSAHANGQILDAYAAAEQIRQKFPEENLAVGELVAFMITANLPAIEISPGAVMLEIFLPVEDGLDSDITDEAHPN